MSWRTEEIISIEKKLENIYNILFPTGFEFFMVITIPFIIIYIILLLYIHFGLGFSLFNSCKEDKDKEDSEEYEEEQEQEEQLEDYKKKECYNKGLYYFMYIIIPLLIAFIISFILYHLLYNFSPFLYNYLMKLHLIF